MFLRIARHTPTFVIRGTAISAAVFHLVLATWGCGPSTDEADLIRSYEQAPCVPRIKETDFSRTNRVWRHPLRLPDGTGVTVHAFQAVGGQVVLEGPDSADHVAIRPPDYIYPADLRYDAAGGLLYVLTSGVRAMGSGETRLYEYDLPRRQIRRAREVDPSRFNSLCP